MLHIFLQGCTRVNDNVPTPGDFGGIFPQRMCADKDNSHTETNMRILIAPILLEVMSLIVPGVVILK